MVYIDRLTLRLPGGYQHRAANIARLVGEGLAQLNYRYSPANMHCLIPSVRLGLNVSDRAIAQAIIADINNRLESRL